jgi:PTS system nitrogen regulatory IIA component
MTDTVIQRELGSQELASQEPGSSNLASLIERGGVYHNVPGATPKDLLAAMINCLPPIPSLDANELYREILEREALVSTGIGRGIALPHPRNPLLGEEGKPFVAVVFPVQPLDWNAPDGIKVHTVFLIVSSSTKQHLGTLSKINFLCQQENFYSLIKGRVSEETIIGAIRKAETSWSKEI